MWRAARELHRALAGKVLTRCDIRVPRFATVDFTGETVQEAVARGKHLLIRGGGEDGWDIHSHLKMEGLWHVYARGEKWRRPSFKARCILETDDAVVVGFDLGFLRVISRAEEDDAVGYLGPDLLGPDWDEDNDSGGGTTGQIAPAGASGVSTWHVPAASWPPPPPWPSWPPRRWRRTRK